MLRRYALLGKTLLLDFADTDWRFRKLLVG